MENLIDQFRGIERTNSKVYDLLYHLGQGRNVSVMKDNPPTNTTVDEAITILRKAGVEVWSGYAKDLTDGQISPKVIENGIEIFDNIHIFDSAQIIILRQCEDIVEDNKICDNLISAFSRRNSDHYHENEPYVPIVITYRDRFQGGYNESFTAFDDLVRGIPM